MSFRSALGNVVVRVIFGPVWYGLKVLGLIWVGGFSLPKKSVNFTPKKC